jgi:hypothetical protein
MRPISFVSGHDFSHADRAGIKYWALAPEGGFFQTAPLPNSEVKVSEEPNGVIIKFMQHPFLHPAIVRAAAAAAASAA